MSVFQKLGIEPVVNCGASRSFYGSSIMSDPVREAIDSASRDYVLMSELGDAVGRRLSELTGAEWGVVSAGSACHAGRDEPSAVLTAMGLSDADALTAIRVSLGRWTTAAEVDAACTHLAGATRTDHP